MTTALCSAAAGGHVKLLDLAEPTFEKYARQWGWDYHRGEIGGDRPASWSKLDVIRALMADYETVVWVDADAMFVRYDRDILRDTDPARPLWMAMHRVRGLANALPNAGVLVAYKTPRLLEFFDEVYDQEQFIDHPWWEQAAMLHLLGYRIDPPGGYATPGIGTEWSPLVGFFGTEWNSMPHDPHPNPLIKHFSGMSFAARLETMRGECCV